MNFQELLDKITLHYKAKLPFVACHKPNEAVVNGYFQNDSTIHFLENYNAKGFIFAPFDTRRKTILIPKSVSEYVSVRFSEFKYNHYDSERETETSEASKKRHLELVTKGVEFISDGSAKKIVLSRKETVQLNDFDLIDTFKKLLNKYPKAMAYVWFHPEIGLWAGATPETFLSVKNQQLSTMALAGTQSYQDSLNVAWGDKEKEEQQYVTDYIVAAIRDEVSQLEVSAPSTVKAGNLLHLNTDISGLLNKKSNLSSLIEKLHPTPAVCGYPKDKAQEFILTNEGYDREYYTGFLGELNHNEETNLFVNLRCMKIENNEAHIFVGGGITLDSSAEKEWQETVDKSKVMKKILN